MWRRGAASVSADGATYVQRAAPLAPSDAPELLADLLRAHGLDPPCPQFDGLDHRRVNTWSQATASRHLDIVAIGQLKPRHVPGDQLAICRLVDLGDRPDALTKIGARVRRAIG